ncbi:MAG: hypothetical protein B7733_25490 [Myxococcales bacterium FL481]|nr:MAG: hypothetical protein B7733_25490 [Myxococcales bacterium FL481]
MIYLSSLRMRTSLLLGLLVAGSSPACSRDQPRPRSETEPVAVEKPPTPAPTPAVPQLPQAEALLAAHVQAAGGADKIPRQVEAKSALQVVEQKLSEEATLWWDDGKFYLEARVEGVGETKAGYDGRVAWSEDPIYRLRELSGRERAQQIRSADLFFVAHWRDYFRSATTVEEREQDDRRYYDVELHAGPGDHAVLSFDAETKLLARVRFDLVTPAGTMNFDTRLSDYRPVAGYLVPHRQVSHTPLLKMEQTYTSITVGKRTDPNNYAPPSDLEVVNVDPTAG